VDPGLDSLDIHAPTAFRGSDLHGLGTCHFQQQKAGDADGNDQKGDESFGHDILAG
jgi:hypothetical protein